MLFEIAQAFGCSACRSQQMLYEEPPLKDEKAEGQAQPLQFINFSDTASGSHVG